MPCLCSGGRTMFDDDFLDDEAQTPDLNDLMMSVATGRPINQVKKEEKEKLLIKVRSLFFAGPASFREKNVYARPFALDEARKILENAGIKFQRITGTAVSSWPDETSQIVGAVVSGREVQFHLQCAKEGKWRLKKAYVATSLVTKAEKIS